MFYLPFLPSNSNLTLVSKTGSAPDFFFLWFKFLQETPMPMMLNQTDELREFHELKFSSFQMFLNVGKRKTKNRWRYCGAMPDAEHHVYIHIW